MQEGRRNMTTRVIARLAVAMLFGLASNAGK
jgi:hypothetical protein